jgi:DNA ligase D-like protein (predicted ligase)
MLLLRTDSLPEGSDWIYEIKLDGYRALAIKSAGKVQLCSRNGNDFNHRYPSIASALKNIPNNSVLDGEIVALDKTGKPSFHLLQNHGSTHQALIYYIFDVLILSGKDVMSETLEERRRLLESSVLSRLAEPIRYSPELSASLTDLIGSVKAQGFEGLIAKRRSSKYEPGLRSGEWRKMRVNQGQELVIGGYTPSPKHFDALIIGYYEGGKLLYAARTRNGFTPSTRAELFKRMEPLKIAYCPFANLPEKQSGRWGAGFTAAKMKDCVWLKPKLVGQFEFVEWTNDLHLRHSRFIALRDDKDPRDVTREGVNR